MEWTTIPVPIDNEQGRRSILAELAEAGLVVHVIKKRKGNSKNAPFARYIEYAEKEEPEE
jgi:hypothetical protein